MTRRNDNTETIAAPATPPGRGGVAVLRVSGPLTKSISRAILKKIPAPRQAIFSGFYAPDETVIDQGLAIFFPGPYSFTGEDVLELHTHGSPVVMDWLIETVLLAGARMARAGEFSERAFLNGKMDLTRVEAVADLIDASSRAAAKCAMRSLQGEFSDQIQQSVKCLTALRVQVEALIDFSDEEIDFQHPEALTASLDVLRQQIRTLIQRAEEGSRLSRGVSVVIAGPPNAGKSSLLNTLSGRSSAIVTDIAGTTRDVLRENILLEGLSLQLTDTAGLRHDSPDVIEQEGIRRAEQEIESADIVLFVTDTAADSRTAADFFGKRSLKGISVRNKIDITGENPAVTVTAGGHSEVFLSAHSGAGMDLLRAEIRRLAGLTDSEGVFSARRRHLDALRLAETHLTAGREQLQVGRQFDCAAEELRLAQQKLCEITGELTSDDLLGEIFSSFCVGK